MALTLIPAIDLRGGRCVRLLQGRLEDETVFSEDPVDTARSWQAQGAPRLHVVDLDGAFGGHPAQADLIRAIIAAVDIPVQVGGGLRDAAAVQRVLDAGARWAVVGTRAALDPAFLGDICSAFPGRLIVSVDASDGKVAVDGWKRVLELDATTLARDAAAAGAAGSPVLASGGVGSLDDLRQLATIPGVVGAIVGRALYSGAVDLRRALAEVG